MMLSRKRCSGFSAIEVTVVTIIVGVLAALAIPQLPKVINNQRVKSAEKSLYEIYCAQKRYFINHGTYASSASQLDTAVNTPSGFSIAVANNASQLATFTNSNSNYSLVINSSGNINCSGNGCTSVALNTATGGSTQTGGGTCTGGGTTGGGNTGGTGGDSGGGVTVGTDPIETDPVNTDPIVTDPIETDPVNTDPIETDPIATDPGETNLEDTYNQLIKMSYKNPEELAKWIEANPDTWQKLLEKYPELEKLVKGDSEPINSEEVESAYKSLLEMFTVNPDDAKVWIEKNPDMWNQLIEMYPELQKLLDGGEVQEAEAGKR